MKMRVARYQADRTNQKLYFVRLCCQLAEQSDQPQLRQCHVESAILHLYGSYLAFLQELARYYNLTQGEPTLAALTLALEKKSQISPEVIRLEKLIRNDFLGEIITAWQQIQYKPAPNIPENTPGEDSEETDITEGGIAAFRLPVVDVMANQSTTHIDSLVVGVSIDMVRQWREQLLSLIDSLREGMIEF